jgi:ChrR-like protein with cupin domain
MNITRNVSVALVSVSLVGALSTTFVFAQSGHVLVTADKVQWGPAPPVLPAGAEIAVLEGNPSEKGAVTLRLRFPANYNIPAHWHSMAERVTVLSGKFNVGMGEKLDRHATQALEPGGFVSLAPKMNHFAWTAVPTVVQINLEGPFDIFYVNPADNPLTKTSTTGR